jgi:hypothetical protein
MERATAVRFLAGAGAVLGCLTGLLTSATGTAQAASVAGQAGPAALTTPAAVSALPVRGPEPVAFPGQAGRCRDARQIGAPGRLVYRGATVASVRQYYSRSCRLNWGSVYVWRGFRARRVAFEVGAAVYSHSTGRQSGNRYFARPRGASFWSVGVSTVGQCTSAYGYLLIGGRTPAEGYSARRC